jgi:hypothetical protein
MPLINNTVTRLPAGITNREVSDIFNSFKMPDPSRYHVFNEDFDYYVAANWVVTETQAGATQALTDGDGGRLLLTNTAADNDLVALQKVGESFLFELAKPLFFRARFQVSDATQSDIIMGLQITDTTPLDVTDGVFFQKDDGDANLDFYAEKNNVQVAATAIATLANDTMVEVAFFWDGVDRIYYGVNGTVLGFIEPSTSLPDDEVLTVSFAIQNGEAVAKTMTIDSILVAKERTASNGA